MDLYKELMSESVNIFNEYEEIKLFNRLIRTKKYFDESYEFQIQDGSIDLSNFSNWQQVRDKKDGFIKKIIDFLKKNIL